MTASGTRNPKFVWQDAFASCGLTPSAGFVGYVMSNHDNGDGRGFYASAQHLSATTGKNLRTVQRAIAELLDSGWIVQESKGGRNPDGTNRASRYSLAIPACTTPVSSEPRDQPAAEDMDLTRQSCDTTPVSPSPAPSATDVVPVDLPLSRPSVDPPVRTGTGGRRRPMAGRYDDGERAVQWSRRRPES